MLTRLEHMRAAASEELETQRVLTDVSKLKASSSWILGEAANGSSEGSSAADGSPTAGASGPAQEPAALDDSSAVAQGPGGPAASDSNNGAPRRKGARDKTRPTKP